jgi:hypothetical protein
MRALQAARCKQRSNKHLQIGPVEIPLLKGGRCQPPLANSLATAPTRGQRISPSDLQRITHQTER